MPRMLWSGLSRMRTDAIEPFITAEPISVEGRDLWRAGRTVDFRPRQRICMRQALEMAKMHGDPSTNCVSKCGLVY